MNVLYFAQHVDQSGQRFYQDMSSRTHDPGIQKIFSVLADVEKMLLDHLQELRENEEEYAKYDSVALNSSDNIFDRMLRQEEQFQFKDDIEAYNLALETERNVVDEYEKAVNRETHPEVRALLQKIVDGERHELEEIEKVYNFVNAPNEYLGWGEFSNIDEFHNFGRDVDI